MDQHLQDQEVLYRSLVQARGSFDIGTVVRGKFQKNGPGDALRDAYRSDPDAFEDADEAIFEEMGFTPLHTIP